MILRDPAEEQLDRPAALVELGDFLGRSGKWAMQCDTMAVPEGTASSATTRNGALDLSRVTMRHCARSSLAHHA